MAYTHAIDALKGVLITLGTSIGAVMLVYGGIKFAMASADGSAGELSSLLGGGRWRAVGLGALVSILT